MFEHLILALVHGSGYERIASPGCSDRTIRRLKQWAAAGIVHQVHALTLAAYDRMIGLGLTEVSVDGCITKAPAAVRKPAARRWTEVQAGKRWVVERLHAWMNDFGKLRRFTDRDGLIVNFYLYLAPALVTLRVLIRRATKRYRWEGRPTTRRLK